MRSPYPKIIAAGVVDLGSAGKSVALVRPWSEQGRCSVNCDATTGSKAVVRAVRGAADDGGIVSVGASPRAAQWIGICPSSGCEACNSADDRGKTHVYDVNEGQEQETRSFQRTEGEWEIDERAEPTRNRDIVGEEYRLYRQCPGKVLLRRRYPGLVSRWILFREPDRPCAPVSCVHRRGACGIEQELLHITNLWSCTPHT